MKPLTKRQEEVLVYVEECLSIGERPTQREVARHFGLSQNAAFQLLRYLKIKGYLSDSRGHRTLRLSEEYIESKGRCEGIPLLGRVAAGEPILAEENIDEYVNLQDIFGQSDDTFLLKVVGDSMVDEGIMDGDLVLVKRTSTIENGKIGVVLLDDEATVKRIYIQSNRIALKPANRAAGYKTRYIKRSEREVRIIGKVIGCMRTNIN
ncbi:MAG: transcriptional repressor LexA [Planctomycetota bacterium]|jgi:repressor LexA